MEIPFYKLHGLGNSYIFVDGFKVDLPESILPKLSIAVSDPNFGIGSDGLILMLPSDVASVKMRVFNKDGSEAKNCGNGLRCVAKLASDLNYVTEKNFTIEAKSGIVHAEVYLNDDHLVDEVTVNMGNPILERRAIPMVTSKGNPNEQVIHEPILVDDEMLNVTAVSMGNPHAVFFVERIDEAPVETVGPKIETDARFPEGANVEFVEIASRNEMQFKVWERGSGMTQACGTGACAAVVASVLNGYVNRNEDVLVHLDGGDLMINWSQNGEVFMKGPAELVVKGSYFFTND